MRPAVTGCGRRSRDAQAVTGCAGAMSSRTCPRWQRRTGRPARRGSSATASSAAPSRIEPFPQRYRRPGAADRPARRSKRSTWRHPKDLRSWFDPIVAQLLLAAAQRAYARRLRAQLTDAALPRHVALVMDGNRRWARQTGFNDPSVGHRYGAEHLDEVLGWCAELGIHYVTIFVVSVDNLRKRAPGEVGFLMRMIEEAAAQRLARPSNQWRLHVAGRLDVLPESTRNALTLARDSTCDGDAEYHTRSPGAAPDGERHLGTPVHQRPARPGSGHPDQRGTADVRFPAVAGFPFGAVLLRCELARLPDG